MNNETKNVVDSTPLETVVAIESVKTFPKHKPKKPVTKEKKYNGFLRNSNRKTKDNSDNSSNQVTHNSTEHREAIQTASYPKENLNSPEYFLFSHLRQKTGVDPNKFWENLHLTLKEKSFTDIKRADMTLIAYAALYESVDIFETLLHQYGNLLPQKEIESSIFKLSTNKNPLILQHTINYYKNLYHPTEDFVDDFFKVAAKASYREDANKLLINWLSPQMTERNIKNFWQTCLEHKNICFINLALCDTPLHSYLKDHKQEFEALIIKSGRQHFINDCLNKKIQNEIVAIDESQISLTQNSRKSAIAIIKPQEESTTLKQEQPQVKTEITVKRKRKVI